MLDTLQADPCALPKPQPASIKCERMITPAVSCQRAVSPHKSCKGSWETVMPHYLFHLSDGEDLFIDDEGKQLEDSGAAHLHALRIMDKVRRFIPDAANSTWKIRITLASGQSVMTVISPALGEASVKTFGRRSELRGDTGSH